MISSSTHGLVGVHIVAAKEHATEDSLSYESLSYGSYTQTLHVGTRKNKIWDDTPKMKVRMSSGFLS